jgi:AraC family transcriptional regulator
MQAGIFWNTDSLVARFASDPPGVVEAAASAFGPAIVVHVGPSTEIACRRGGFEHRGVAVHGDVDIVPANTPSRWELKQRDQALIIGVHRSLIESAAEERGLDTRRIEIRNRFQVRDARIEHLTCALEGPSVSRLYADSVATALAVRLIDCHSSAAPPRQERASLPGRKLRHVLAYIEDNLARDLALLELASLAGIGASQFKKAFRETVGVPVHRYVIARRVERAKTLLRNSRMPIAQIAAETGFAHQSHLARLLRRLAGVSPREFRDS